MDGDQIVKNMDLTPDSTIIGSKDSTRRALRARP
jgi:hypothetical protein